MNVTFDGPNKLIICGSGLTAFNAVDLYSAWKVWVAESDNAKYLPAFREIGGDPLGGGAVVSPYFFLTEGWRVRPQETSHTLIITGNLLTEEGDSPVIPTVGDFNVLVKLVTSANSITTVVTTGGSALTQEEHDQLMAVPLTTLTVEEHNFLVALPTLTMTVEEHDKLMAIVSNVGELVIEGSLTLSQYLRIMMAALAGKTTGGGGSELRFRDLADAVDRIIATVDSNGNRTAITVNGA
jgi:hypothetical protein